MAGAERRGCLWGPSPVLALPSVGAGGPGDGTRPLGDPPLAAPASGALATLVGAVIFLLHMEIVAAFCLAFHQNTSFHWMHVVGCLKNHVLVLISSIE